MMRPLPLIVRSVATGFSFPLQNWHRAATYIPEMLSKTKLFE